MTSNPSWHAGMVKCATMRIVMMMHFSLSSSVRCRYGDEGQKERYFADDDNKDLDQLVREQRYGDPGDMDAAFASNVASKSRYRCISHSQASSGNYG